MGIGTDGTRLFLFTVVLGASSLLVASACSSSSNSSNTAADAGGVVPSDGGVDETVDGSRKDNDPDASSCLASNNAAPTCSTPTCQAECQNAATNFNPDVATSIVACMTNAVSATAADTDCQAAAPSCVSAGAAAACTDTTAADFCTSFITSCPDAVDGGSTAQTHQDCVDLVQSMTDTGRTSLQNCVTEETNNCAGCITSLRALTLAASH